LDFRASKFGEYLRQLVEDRLDKGYPVSKPGEPLRS
jgi:hypothetical protein